jgi:hypothetical protein
MKKSNMKNIEFRLLELNIKWSQMLCWGTINNSSIVLRIFLNCSDIKIGFCAFPSCICFHPKNEQQHTPEADVFSLILFSPDCTGPATVYSKGWKGSHTWKRTGWKHFSIVWYYVSRILYLTEKKLQL